MAIKCSFCGKSIPKGNGKILVKNSGQIFHFCDSKCDRNFALGRQGKHVKWTETAKSLKGK